jgi:hypothetical protein
VCRNDPGAAPPLGLTHAPAVPRHDAGHFALRRSRSGGGIAGLQPISVNALAVFDGGAVYGGSYLSVSDSRFHFGLGPVARIDVLTARWPGGKETVLRDVETNRVVKVHR